MNTEFIIYLIIMAGVTYLVRMLPLVLVRRKITNEFVLSFIHYLPYAVLAVMTVPAVFFATDSIISAVVGVAIAVMLSFFNRGLFTVALSACAGVYITELIMRLIG